MKSYKTAATISGSGELHLSELPFHAGDEVEVILLPRKPAPQIANPYPLRGQPICYEDPTEPVAEEDWEALH
ncbi:MAG TPA: hypothetical protein VGR07_12400 [Thermoanaerobaculia bacterium]|nr:hypothetical protein [Thermoanaerobaculia bacterium]